MTQLHARPIEDEIRQTLDNFNRAWRERRFDELSQFLDEDVLMNGTGLKRTSASPRRFHPKLC